MIRVVEKNKSERGDKKCWWWSNAILNRVLGKVSLVRWHLRSKGGDGEPAIWEEGIFLEKSFTQDRGQRPWGRRILACSWKQVGVDPRKTVGKEVHMLCEVLGAVQRVMCLVDVYSAWHRSCCRFFNWRVMWSDVDFQIITLAAMLWVDCGWRWGQGQKQGYRYVDLSIIRMRGDSGLNLGERSRDGKWLDSKCILKVEPTGFTDRLDRYYKRKRGARSD